MKTSKIDQKEDEKPIQSLLPPPVCLVVKWG